MAPDLSRPELLSSWEAVAEQSLGEAVKKLCAFFSVPLTSQETASGIVPLGGVTQMIPADDTFASVSLTMSGGADGTLCLLYKPEEALKMVDFAMGDPPGTATEIDEMAESVLGEAGNTVGGAFVSKAADLTGLGLWMSVPTVRMEKAGIVVIQALECLKGRSEAAVASVAYKIADGAIEGSFVVFADPAVVEPQQLAA